jgi:hypothetical protein
VKILPYTNRGISFISSDGKVELLPFEVRRTKDGGTVICIGRNAYFFDESGKFDGPEHKVKDVSFNMDELTAAIEKGRENEGFTPDEPYFESSRPVIKH